ncbi:hypothetical protein AAF712_009583 [Marasmius tenuissimus]|uniref:Uncharacterized protein n=1 Tax=Marasmius tenuissimus TaxID=585030 RepID=A0ABR2ZRJ8_9AGAR
MVVNLYIHSPTPNLLRFCPNVRFLFLDWEGSTSSKLVSAIPPSNPWPVPSTIFLGPLPRAHTHLESISPLFQQVVRLCISHAEIQSLLRGGPKSLPALTHLAIRIDSCDLSTTFFDGNPSRYWQGVSPIQQVLRAFGETSGLQKLLLVFECADSLYGEWWLQAAENNQDERVFARPRLREEEYERMMDFHPDEGTALREDNGSDFWDDIDSDWRGKVRDSKINLAPLSDSDMERREYDRYFR